MLIWNARVSFTYVNLKLFSDIEKYQFIEILIKGVFLRFVRAILKLTIDYYNSMVVTNQHLLSHA